MMLICHFNDLFHFRTYSLVPKDVGKFLALSKEKFYLRTQHSVLLGGFGLNAISYLSPFQSRILDSRTWRPESSCTCLEVW